MGIITKFVLKNAFEKKGRLLLLIISIIMSTVLLVVSIGLLDLLKEIYSSPIREFTESMEISIKHESQPFFSLQDMNTSTLDEYHGEIAVTGILGMGSEISCLNIRGKEQSNLNSYHFIGGGIEDFKDNKCIISKRISDENDLVVGDTFDIAINGDKHNFVVAAISSNEGIFYMDKNNEFSIIVPYQYLSDYFKAYGKYNYMLAKLENSDMEDVLNQFYQENPNFIAEKLLDEDSIRQQYSMFSQILYLMLAVVILVSSVIIHGVFKLIISERMPVIGVFLSQGSTKGMLKRILYLESIGYGAIGSFLGSIIGIAVLFIIGRVMSPLAEYGIIEPFVMNIIYPIIGLGFGIVIALISAIVPIRAINKLPVKEVILNDIRDTAIIGWKKPLAGIILLVISLIGYYADTDWAISMSPLFLICSIVGVLLICPKIINLITNPFCKLLKGKSNILFLALNNVRTSKFLLNNIVLIIIAFLASILISSLGFAMIDSVKAAYEDVNYDITISNILESPDENSTTKKIIEKVQSLSFVVPTSINPYIYIFGDVDGTRVVPLGIEPHAYREYMSYLNLNEGKNSALYDDFSLQPDSGVILTDTLKRKINKNDGDMISIEIGGKKNDYKILGSIDGGTYMDGIFILMDLDTMQRKYRIREATYITLKTDISAEIAKQKILEELKNHGIICTTRQEDSTVNLNRNNQMVQIFSLFSTLTVIISAMGVFNNISISFIQRKKELAAYNSVGMNRKKRIIMLLFESFSCVIWSALIILPFSLISLGLISKVAKLIGYSADIVLNINSIPTLIAEMTLIIIIASLPTVFKSQKLSTAHELRYE